jgi:hypothetical protein
MMSTLLSVNQVSNGVAPREPLTFANVGLYGGWNEYLVSKESPFDFLIIQANVIDGKVETWRWHSKGDTFSWNDFLKLARANGKRVIADVDVIITDETGQKQSFPNLYNSDKIKNPLPIERFLEMFDRFFEEVDEEELYAITIAEEHVFWNGQQERLEHAYDYLKKKYDIPLYQWYTPSQTGATPGHNYPNVRADGWMVDEYWLQKPAIEIAMRMYTILQKPAFQIVWAAPDMPTLPWSERTFWDQYETCRKYNVPIAFFCWRGEDKTPATDTWGWYPNTTPEMRRVFEDFCVHAARLAKALPPVSRSEWDLVPLGQKQVKLTVDETRKDHAVYQETFEKPRDITLWLDTTITGFSNLKWDSSPIQLKPRVAGDATSTIRYCFDSPQKIKSIRAEITGELSGGQVELKILDMHCNLLAETSMKGDNATIHFDANQHADTRFVLTITMKGTATEPGQKLAEFSGISVEAELAN